MIPIHSSALPCVAVHRVNRGDNFIGPNSGQENREKREDAQEKNLPALPLHRHRLDLVEFRGEHLPQKYRPVPIMSTILSCSWLSKTRTKNLSPDFYKTQERRRNFPWPHGPVGDDPCLTFPDRQPFPIVRARRLSSTA